MRALYEAANLHEAQLLVHRLEERGIRTHVRNAQLHGALVQWGCHDRTDPSGKGVVSRVAEVLPIVCITEPIRWKHAQAVLEEFLEALRAPVPDDVVCPSCGETNPGNFEICWRCAAELPTR